MERRHLRHYVVVTEELHFRRAADRLHVAEPAVSEHVPQRGVQVFHRTQRSVSLTDAGAPLLARDGKVPDQADLARAATLTARDRATSRLRVACMPTARPTAIPATVRRLTAGVPDRETELDSGAPLELVESGASAPRLRALAVCRSVAMNSPYARWPSRAGKRSTCPRSLSFAPSPGRRRLAGRRPDTHPSSRSREPA